ncbi:hypothetical protein MtrunA17_Chr6g0473761 [Medicago truncatula]|uniref:Uncharacterized protein n=1 Tax=Medicago truncatula TaxID=3880 RepID=A0A396HEW7_MEDTR|nr:hypothetical protein MtrunA17_Chr6g0473761 [Medicago truncatula]
MSLKEYYYYRLISYFVRDYMLWHVTIQRKRRYILVKVNGLFTRVC